MIHQQSQGFPKQIAHEQHEGENSHRQAQGNKDPASEVGVQSTHATVQTGILTPGATLCPEPWGRGFPDPAISGRIRCLRVEGQIRRTADVGRPCGQMSYFGDEWQQSVRHFPQQSSVSKDGMYEAYETHSESPMQRSQIIGFTVLNV